MEIFDKCKKKYSSIPIQLKATLFFMLCAFGQKAIALITTPIFTRLLNTAEFGQYSVFNAWFDIITIFVSFSLTGGVYTQGLIKYEEDRKVFSSSMQGLTLLLTLAWTIVYLLFDNWWNDLFGLTKFQMLSMFVLIWTNAVFGFWSNEQRVDYKYKALVIISLCMSALSPIVGIIFVVLAEDKVSARIMGSALVNLIGYSGLFFIQISRGKKICSLKYWKYALVYNLPLVPHYLSQIVLNSADRIMIEKMVGYDEAGIYSLAYAVSSVMFLVNTALMQTLSPWIYQKIKRKQEAGIKYIAYSTLGIVALANLMLILLAPDLIAFFAPEEYHGAIFIVPPIAISVYYIFCYDLFAKFAFYYEKTKLIMLASIMGAMLNVVLNYYFISKYGYLAAGYTTLVCYIIYSFAHYCLMNIVCKKYCDSVKPYDSRMILAISVPFTVLGLLLRFTYNYPVMRYGIIGTFVIALFVFRRRILGLQRIIWSKSVNK